MKNENVTQKSIENHFVPQMYLEAWKNENKDKQIYEYKLLVPHKDCPVWSSRYIESIAKEDNFYICLKGEEESDEIEKWLNEKFETPAKNPLENAINGEKLNSEDFKKIIDFIACQIVRTPAFLEKFLRESKKITSQQFENIVKETTEDIINQAKRKDKYEMKQTKNVINENPFPLKIIDTGISYGDMELFQVKTVIGKSLYLTTLRHYLTKTLDVLHKHRWQIIELDKNVSIPTSDDPVICLNYYGNNRYDFNGGWARKGSEIIFPISPRKIIYTHIGYKKKIKPNYDLSLAIKRMIVEHAHMKIFSNFEDMEIIKYRKRCIDKEAFEREKTVFKNFHENYKNIEKSYLNVYKNNT